MPERRNLIVMLLTRTVVGVLVLGAAVGVFLLLFRTRPVAEVSTGGETAPHILVIRARPVPVARRFVGYGTVQAMERADVPARITATVQRVPAAIEAGAAVSAGTLLVQLDQTDFQREVEIATENLARIEADLARLDVEMRAREEQIELSEEAVALARGELDRYQAALEAGAARAHEVDAARQALIAALRDAVAARESRQSVDATRRGLEAQRRAQESALRIARENLARTDIVSPIAGRLQSVDVKQGESVTAGARVARVVDVGRIEIPLRLPAAARAEVRVGDRVELRSAGAGRGAWTGTVARIAPEDDERTRTMTAFVELTQARDAPVLLAPGTFVEGVVIARRVVSRTVVPRRAVVDERVFVVEGRALTSRSVDVAFPLEMSLPESGVDDTQWLALEEGLEAGTLVVVNASRTLVEGATVRPLPAGESMVARDGEEGGAAETAP